VTWTPEQEREFYSIMDQEADKLTDLVGQLLDVSSLAAGTLRIQPWLTSVQAILDGARTALTRLAADHRLMLDIPADLPLVTADSARIGQVLINLVHNAAKYAPAGTTITLSARRDGDDVLFSVRDEGPGIPVSEREHVFEAFQQVVQGVRPPGAGLGLAICKGLVEAHGGRIWIEDGEGRGAVISFTLPVARQ
jgi:two-component system sensor histidine kinase KdpD